MYRTRRAEQVPAHGRAAAALDLAAGRRPPLPCRVHDPDLWFAEAPADLERAKELCATCPVRAACLDGALLRREPHGVWGGEILAQGVVVPRKRPRGRPPKNPPPVPCAA